jgi:hypothetical protein
LVLNDPPSDFDYYSAPAYVDAVAIAMTLERTHFESHARWSPEEFIFLYKMTGSERNWKLLAIANGSEGSFFMLIEGESSEERLMPGCVSSEGWRVQQELVLPG